MDESDGGGVQGIHGLDLGGGRWHLCRRRQRTLQQLRGEGEVMRGKGEL